MVVWADLPERPHDFQRPKRWKDKNFGQWCRNLTINRHTQCPPASPFHWFVCCGESGVECCGGIQTWAYFVFGSLFMSAFIIFSFYVLLKFDLICQQSTWPTDRDSKKECEKMVESPGKTRPSTPCSTLLSSQSSSDNSPSMSPANQTRDEVTHNLTDVESRDPECHSDMKVVVVDGPQRRL
ncbi:protein SUP-1 [Ditylenchus destructor]|uniref:Protein SUP-1 n=1 Tax=Ditylenchus destructor TaxID=166010 RepID=A0AAD4MYG2_9BILA|nr:protein SUP-1 [Ditylenchus destructor]